MLGVLGTWISFGSRIAEVVSYEDVKVQPKQFIHEWGCIWREFIAVRCEVRMYEEKRVNKLSVCVRIATLRTDIFQTSRSLPQARYQRDASKLSALQTLDEATVLPSLVRGEGNKSQHSCPKAWLITVHGCVCFQEFQGRKSHRLSNVQGELYDNNAPLTCYPPAPSKV